MNTVLAMWATQPSYSCVMIEEPRQHLNLEREVDREHLARDARRIHQVARRYAVHLGDTAAGVNSDAPASSTDADAEQCQENFAFQLATVHDVQSIRFTQRCPPSVEIRAYSRAARSSLSMAAFIANAA